MNKALQTWWQEHNVAGYKWLIESPKFNVLLQHGYGEYLKRYTNSYSNIVGHLNTLGGNVYGFDLPGHGDSEGRKENLNLIEASAIHLGAKDILASEPLPLLILGHSLGSLISAHTVSLSPEGVDAAVLLSPGFAPQISQILSFVSRILSRIAPYSQVPYPFGTVEDLSRRKDVREQLENDPQYSLKRPSNIMAYTSHVCSERVYSAAPSWAVPTLCMHGTADHLVDVKVTERFQAAANTSMIEFVYIKSAYHELLNDLGSEETIRIILNWIKDNLKIEK